MNLPSGADAPDPGRALFTRFVRRRNFAGFPFWVSASPAARAALTARALDYAASQGFDAGARLADLSPAEIGYHREQGRLPEHPVTLPGTRELKRLFTGALPGEHALFGEVEHWTRVRRVAGLPDPGAMPATRPAEDAPFARSAAYGFLTSNPAFAGTGLQIEAGLHLPALAAERKPGQGMPAVLEIQKALGAMGFDLQPLSLRTPGSAESGYFRMISRGGMDFPEESLYEHFAAKVKHVLAVEAGALERWREREPNALEDRVYRALRLLQEARRMEYAELLSLASYGRIGVYLGIFPRILRNLLETLRIEAQPFSLRKSAGAAEGDPDPEFLHQARAALARELTAGIEPGSGV